jgi:hypothetical protein
VSGAGIAFAGLSLVFAWLLWAGRGAGAEPVWRLRLRSAIPPLLLIACLPSGCGNERFDALRLYARGMSVTETGMQGGRRPATAAPGCEAYFGAGDTPVFVVGRARGCVDLVVQDPGGPPVDGTAVRLDGSGGADAALRLASLSGNGSALITAQDGEDGRSYVGALPLAEGDSLCINHCSAADAAWWTLHGNALEPARGGGARALRVRSGLFGSVRPYRPTERVQRLSSLLCAAPAEGGDCPGPALADPAQPGERAQPAVSFLFQSSGGWQAMLLDPGSMLRRADGEVVRPALVVSQPLAQGASRHLALLALRGNALRELRSFTLGHSFTNDPSPKRSFTLNLDTPELIPIGNCTEPLSRLAVVPEEISPEAFAIPAFGNRPGSALSSAAAALPIDEFDFCRSTRFAFSSPLDPPNGAATGTELKQVRFEIDRMGVPWPLVLLAALVALMIHAASERLWEREALDGLILAVAQYLLVLRAIIGIEGVFNDTGVDWRAIYTDVGTALVVLPCILVSARRREETSLGTIAALGGFAAAAFGALWLWLGAPDTIGLFLWGLAFGALAGRAVTALLSKASPLVGEVGGGPAASAAEENPSFSIGTENLPAAHAAEPPPQPLPTRGRGLSGGISSLPARIIDRSPNFWPILLGIIVAARILLGLLGFRERMFGIALSAIYVPLLLTAIAGVLAQGEEQAGKRRWTGLLFHAALGVGAGLVALIINDIGFALVHVPPIAGVALWRLRCWSRDKSERPDRLTGLIWAAPSAALVVGYLGLWAMVALTPPPPDDAPLEQRVAYAVSDHSTDPNWLRLRAVFAPGQIERIGNRAAAIQEDQSQLLGDLTGTLFGRGWLTPVDLGTFRLQATHLSDYLSASHLMAPFGRAGALALLLVLAAAAGAAVTRRVPVPAAWPNLAGALAVWTLFGAAAYMICANLLLVPFTGRNIYLLAASSGGDLIEGLFLLLIARIGLAYRRSA